MLVYRVRVWGHGGGAPVTMQGTLLGRGDGVSFWIGCVTFVTGLVGQGSNLQPAD